MVSPLSPGPIAVGFTFNPTARISASALLWLHDAGLHAIIEDHLVVFEMVREMAVGGAAAEVVGDVRQRQIVRRHQSDGAAFDQAAHHRLGADATIVRVRAREDFVEEKQER